jgi:hypothetical protein
MRTAKRLIRTVQDALKQQAPRLARPLGLTLLDKAQTMVELAPAEVLFRAGERVVLPEIPNLAELNTVLFPETAVEAAPAHVWQCQNDAGTWRQLRNGSISMAGHVPDTDFGNTAVLSDVFSRRRRSPIEADVLLAPWSHYWGGYSDYLLFVVAKLCRMKDALPLDVFERATVAYPLLHTPFEAELLTLAGISAGQAVDSRRQSVRFKSCVLGNNDSWFFLNQADVQSVRRHITSRLPPPTGPPKRLYISRSGRRRVLNEDALVQMLDRYGFEVVPDQPRPVAEQVALYQNASVVLGPHGASFANVLFCQPGTHLIELFAPGYVPEFFRYLAHLLQLPYAAYCHGEAIHYPDHRAVTTDMTIDLAPLEQYISEM